jgi:hypothetical protein
MVEVQQNSTSPQSVTTQGFLDMLSIMPMMFIMFFFVLMMGLMRDITREPGAAKEIVIKGVETGKEVVSGIAGARRG